MLEILTYCKNRVTELHIKIKYYEALEESRGVLTRAEEMAYNNCLTSVNELGSIINFIDELLESISVKNEENKEEE